MSPSEAALDAQEAPTRAWPRILKIGAGVAALALLILLGREAGAYVQGFASWVDGLGVWGPVVFITGYALATVAFVPGSLLTMAGGVLFGLAWGTAYVFVGATAGATIAFLVSRYVARHRVEQRIAGNERFSAIDRAVGQNGFKIVFLLRLSPVFPFNLLNYALGLSRVRLLPYVLACCGMVPGTFLYVYYGKAVGDLASLASGGAASEQGAERWIFLGIGLVATALVTTLVTRLARRALREEVSDA